MLFAMAALVAAGLYLEIGPNTEEPPPLVQLIADIETAVPRAHLSEAQKHQLESDESVFRTTSEAKQQGRPVDRQQVSAAVKDLRKLLESGAFSAGDQKKLNADIVALRNQ